jgi:hypothetical protein
MRPYTIYQAFLLVPQNAIDRELCLRITNGNTACRQAGGSAKRCSMADRAAAE